jgi:predicted transcriptional regulator
MKALLMMYRLRDIAKNYALNGTCWRIIILLADCSMDVELLANELSRSRNTIYGWLNVLQYHNLVAVKKEGNRAGIYMLV